MQKLFILVGSLAGALGVMIGAFGAHALRKTLENNNRIQTFDTAVQYHFFHALALVALGLVMMHFQHKVFIFSGYSFMVGIILFSGSLYALSVTNHGILGAIAPLGGFAFILGWLGLAWGVLKSI